jgi:hypothetical protein|tara:strand:+ start:2176 stop:2325 length:150 start_codon:yes stop_codon:yes gene_type:complete
MDDGQRVSVEGKEGNVSFSVPGNGSIRWYIVQFDDGTEDRFTLDQLTPA